MLACDGSSKVDVLVIASAASLTERRPAPVHRGDRAEACEEAREEAREAAEHAPLCHPHPLQSGGGQRDSSTMWLRMWYGGCASCESSHLHLGYRTPNAPLFAELGPLHVSTQTSLPQGKVNTRCVSLCGGPSDASRRAENIGTHPPQAQSTLRPVVEHQPLLLWVSR
jgi:hypothetical protein